MDDEEKEWSPELVKKRDDLKENVASILRLFAKDLLPERLKDTVLPSEPNADANATRPSGQTGNKNDMAVQTTQVDALVLVNGHNELRSRSQSQVPQDTNVNADSVLARPFPEGEEALRAEVAILSAKIVEQQSSIRSLEQVAINLRETNAALYAQQEEHLKQIREAEARENSQAFERANIKANLDRAAQEVQTLRTEIRNFHQPASRLYKSIKDAVLREMRGEEPLTHAMIDSAIWVKSSRTPSSNDDQRPHKRPRIGSSVGNPARSRTEPERYQNLVLGPPPQQRRNDLTIVTEHGSRNDLMQGVPLSAPPTASQHPHMIPTIPPGEVPAFTQAVRRGPPNAYQHHQYSIMAGQQPQQQLGSPYIYNPDLRQVTHSGMRQDAQANRLPPGAIQRSPPAASHLALQIPHHPNQNPANTSTPTSRAAALPGVGWHPQTRPQPQPPLPPQPSDRQPGSATGVPIQTHVRRTSNGIPPPPVHRNSSDQIPAAMPNNQLVLSNNPPPPPTPTASGLNMRFLVPTELDNVKATMLCALLWSNMGGRTYQCKQCNGVGDLGADYRDLFQHSHVSHKEAFDKAYFEVYPESRTGSA